MKIKESQIKYGFLAYDGQIGIGLIQVIFGFIHFADHQLGLLSIAAALAIACRTLGVVAAMVLDQLNRHGTSKGQIGSDRARGRASRGRVECGYHGILFALIVEGVLDYVPRGRRDVDASSKRYPIESNRARERIRAHILEYHELVRGELGQEALLDDQVQTVTRGTPN